jgi:hypothetical protein
MELKSGQKVLHCVWETSADLLLQLRGFARVGSSSKWVAGAALAAQAHLPPFLPLYISAV